MKIKDILVLEEAVEDLHKGTDFYDRQEAGVGNYFWDCLISDIESLILYAGIHIKKHGFYRMYSRRFPYAIYYEIINDIVYVAAVLPMRRDPAWIINEINKR